MSKKQKNLLPVNVEELVRQSVQTGLEMGNPNMVKQVNEMIAAADAENILRDFSVEITPKEIADTSLRIIVLKAPDNVIEEIKQALEERLAMTLQDRLDKDEVEDG